VKRKIMRQEPLQYIMFWGFPCLLSSAKGMRASETGLLPPVRRTAAGRIIPLARARVHDPRDITLHQVALTDKFAGCCRKPR
jgi:hypothetical protein